MTADTRDRIQLFSLPIVETNTRIRIQIEGEKPQPLTGVEKEDMCNIETSRGSREGQEGGR